FHDVFRLGWLAPGEQVRLVGYHRRRRVATLRIAGLAPRSRPRGTAISLPRHATIVARPDQLTQASPSTTSRPPIYLSRPRPNLRAASIALIFERERAESRVLTASSGMFVT